MVTIEMELYVSSISPPQYVQSIFEPCPFNKHANSSCDNTYTDTHTNYLHVHTHTYTHTHTHTHTVLWSPGCEWSWEDDHLSNADRRHSSH